MNKITVLTAAIVLVASVASAAGETAVITGTVFDDPLALALPERFRPVPGVAVRLYRDGGDGVPSMDDVLTARSTTNAEGTYSLPAAPQTTYWVVVDSTTLPRGTTGCAWPEQTYGPAGSLCAQPDGLWRTNYVGSVCMGGRRLDTSDDVTSITRAEHIAGVRVTGNVRSMDFAFSYNVVTNAADSTTDDVPVQGSLRQFIENANAIPGANVMRFVPIARPTQEDPGVMQSETPRWWLLRATRPFPEIRDDETVVDGTSYSFLSPISAIDRNPGKVGLRPALPPFVATPAPQQERPELEISVAGEEGLACAARCVIRMLAIHGPRVSIVTRADARVEHVMIGTQGDAVTSEQRGEVGLQVEEGTTTAEHLLIEVQTTAGVAAVGKNAIVDARFLDVGYCGKPPVSGAAIALFSDGSTVRYSVLHQNEGAGVVIGDPASNTPATANRLETNTISRNGAAVVLSPGASKNTITRNMIQWNGGGGVVAVHGEGTRQHANVITENIFNENGLRPIILRTAEDANALALGSDQCKDDPTQPNGGLTPPKITSVESDDAVPGGDFVIRGTGCPGRRVEIYRSFVTAAVREPNESRLIRKTEKKENEREETLTITHSRILAVDSIGEFNFVTAVTVADDGTFEARVPYIQILNRRRSSDPEQFELWADEALRPHDPNDSAFSALTIDAEGNTSELSVRHAAPRARKQDRPPSRR